MRIERIELRDFRNYACLDLELSPDLTVLVGPNAAGKTSVVEAIQLVTAGRSFRKPRTADLIRFGTEAARVSMRAAAGERLFTVRLDLTQDGSRTFTVNGSVKRRVSDVVGTIPSVVFAPDDLDMVKGPAERRRAAIDDLGEQLSSTYGTVRRDYGRAVRQRNTLLRDGVTGDPFDVWTDQVVELGSLLLQHRLRLLDRLMDTAAVRYGALAGGEVLSYRYDDRCGLGGATGATKEEIAASMRAELERRAGEEVRRVSTLVGPHRDDVAFLVEGRDARSFGSQGQQRTIALAWKLAEIDTIREIARTTPVLLLDDVMSELDAARRDALAGMVTEEVQTVMTTTTVGYFSEEIRSRAKVVGIGEAS